MRSTHIIHIYHTYIHIVHSIHIKSFFKTNSKNSWGGLPLLIWSGSIASGLYQEILYQEALYHCIRSWRVFPRSLTASQPLFISDDQLIKIEKERGQCFVLGNVCFRQIGKEERPCERRLPCILSNWTKVVRDQEVYPLNWEDSHGWADSHLYKSGGTMPR